MIAATAWMTPEWVVELGWLWFGAAVAAVKLLADGITTEVIYYANRRKGRHRVH